MENINYINDFQIPLVEILTELKSDKQYQRLEFQMPPEQLQDRDVWRRK